MQRAGGKAGDPKGGGGPSGRNGPNDLYTRYLCNYCQEDLVGLRITCAVCKDFDLCLECFSCGAELGSHKSSHKYIFANNAFTVFQKPKEDNEKGKNHLNNLKTLL